ncbi:MAG: amidase [Candidatus Binataceae bacterium]
MTAELHFKSAFDLAAMIRRRELKVSELMEATIARIEALNPKFNAFCALRADEAMAEARALDERIAHGEAPGALAGLPLGVKDLEGVAGMKTTFGSKPFKDNLAREDSIQVARLKAAGAIVIGKTNTPEFGFTPFTKNLLYGVTRNPWNAERTSGGSSGGSSAALAAGMVPLTTGSDWGGSIRIPAAHTGCVGHKATQGLIPASPRLGMTTWVDFAMLGPLTRTVRDAAIYMDAVVGYHPADASSLPHPGISYSATLEQLPKKLRIAFHPDFGHVVQHDLLREVEKAVSAFHEMGYEITVLKDEVPEIADAWRTIGAFQSLSSLGGYIDQYREDFGRAFLANLENAKRITWREYGEAYRVRTRFNEWARGVFERFDLLLTPTVAVEAYAAGGPPPNKIDGHPIHDIMHTIVFTHPFNMSGHPAVSVRAGFTDSGLPCGLQIVADRHHDHLVMQAAYAYEQARPWNNHWARL